ncbi:MAG: protein-glutamate O-methyltransferase CheR [Sandaracinaceae bacterium]|nr:protein-glutamate O-methyltransferase CheR [Sandaracinaceae bacterium]
MSSSVTKMYAADLSGDELSAIADYLHGLTGIRLDGTKRELVKSRLGRRMRVLGLLSYAEYLERVRAETGAEERTRFVDALTTNLTYFFREEQHFTFLAENVLAPAARTTKGVRLWSAGCSSGEEPYTMSMVARERLGERGRWASETRILATDLSTDVLRKAREGLYPADSVEKVPEPYRSRYFQPLSGDEAGLFRVSQDIRSKVQIARLNLMADWPMRGPFDAIFCRNVMIYFDANTKSELVLRFHRLLRPGGYFFTSLSESLHGRGHPFEYVAPGVYRA